jgi:DNA-binding transcriptional ArsR family regulator
LIENALKAIAEPRRQAMLRLLKNGDGLTQSELGERLQITQQAASLHLKTLLEAGLVSARREGARHLYYVRPEGFRLVEDFLREFWGEHLMSLKREAESDG